VYNELTADVTVGASSLTFQSWGNNGCSGTPDYSSGLSNACGNCYEINPTVVVVMNGNRVPYHALGNSVNNRTALKYVPPAVAQARSSVSEIADENTMDGGVDLTRKNAPSNSTVGDSVCIWNGQAYSNNACIEEGMPWYQCCVYEGVGSWRLCANGGPNCYYAGICQPC